MVDIMPDVLVPYTQIIVSYVNWFLLPTSSRNEMNLAINSLCPASGVVTDHAHGIYSDCIILDLVLYWQSGIRPRLKIRIDSHLTGCSAFTSTPESDNSYRI